MTFVKMKPVQGNIPVLIVKVFSGSVRMEELP